MKKVISLAALLTLSLVNYSSFADGEFDGIWETSVGEYASIIQNGDSLVAIRLVPSNLEWEAFQGDLVNNSATLTTVVSEVTASLRLDFDSPTTGSVTVLTCVPLNQCEFPPGAQFTAVKIF